MMKTDELQKHILATYFDMRVGVAVIALLFPAILALGGNCLGVAFQPSLSDYYHTYMRNGFVGMLFIIGSFLYLYRGFGKWENWLLNIAGWLAIGVALIPTNLKCQAVDEACKAKLNMVFTGPTIHTICAVGFFICIAIVCIACSKKTLDEIKDPGRRKFYKWLYGVLGFLMVALPFAAAIMARFTELANPDVGSHVIFWVEAAGVWVFASYWFAKSIEIRKTEKEKHAIELSFAMVNS